MSDHSREYTNYLNSPTWRNKSRWVRSLTRPFWLSKKSRGRCVLFPFLPAQQTHHLTYYFILNLGWNEFGLEMPFLHLVPLSNVAHDLVGSKLLWQQPIRFFVNTYLRLAFVILWTICKPLWSIPFWYAIYWTWQSYNYLLEPAMFWLKWLINLIKTLFLN